MTAVLDEIRRVLGDIAGLAAAAPRRSAFGVEAA